MTRQMQGASVFCFDHHVFFSQDFSANFAGVSTAESSSPFFIAFHQSGGVNRLKPFVFILRHSHGVGRGFREHFYPGNFMPFKFHFEFHNQGGLRTQQEAISDSYFTMACLGRLWMANGEP